jgi:lipid-binding SYLF domain-containing protein
MKTIRVAGLMVTLTLVGAVAALAAEGEQLDSVVANAIQTFRTSSPRLDRLFSTAFGYAVFPSVDKGAAGIGAAEGRGLVYENGVPIGRAKLTQVTVGAQLGGQSYTEVIFFESVRAMDEFKDGKTAVSAALSAVAGDAGASAEAKYQHGLQVYTMTKAGLMFEASIGGQHFRFTPMDMSSMPNVTVTPPGSATAPSAPAAVAPETTQPPPPSAPPETTQPPPPAVTPPPASSDTPSQ